MARKKSKPFDPALASRIRADREANAEMAGTLRAQPSTAVNVDPRTGRLTGAWRMNCFNTLLSPGSPERGAVDWLDELVRTANGENGQERRPDFIRATAEGAPGQNVTDAMIEAGRRLAVVLEALPPAYARMMLELLKPDADLITRWRGVVERCTGERDHQAQAGALRATCTTLVWVRETIDRRERAKTDRRAA